MVSLHQLVRDRSKVQRKLAGVNAVEGNDVTPKEKRHYFLKRIALEAQLMWLNNEIESTAKLVDDDFLGEE